MFKNLTKYEIVGIIISGICGFIGSSVLSAAELSQQKKEVRMQVHQEVQAALKNEAAMPTETDK